MNQSAYHKWLLKQRIWCEHGERRGIPCMAVATTVRGKDDPHFQDLSGGGVCADSQNVGTDARCATSSIGVSTDEGGRQAAQSFPSVDEQLKSWTDRDYELIAGRIYRKPWYEREDWEVPGNGGTNDHLFEDGDPQEYGDGSPD